MFFGEDILALLMLALGGALAIGNIVAMVRPPKQVREGDLQKAPLARSLIMSTIGLLAAIWAIASLVSS